MKKAFSNVVVKVFRAVAFWIIRVFALAAFNVRVHIEGERPKGGAIVLCTHHTIFDFTFLCRAVKPAKPRFVARSLEFERNRLYTWVLNALGFIPKKQGAMDLVCVRTIVNGVKNGDLVAIYPTGMNSYDGRPGWAPMQGTGSLMRMANAPVYVAVMGGAFISHPRYTTVSYRGRVDITLKQLFTPEELKAMTGDEAQRKIEEALQFNEWDWQEKNRVRFHGGKSVRDLPVLLYTCPDCGKKGVMTAVKKKKLVCSACGMTAVRDSFGFFHAEKGNCPARMDKWVDIELDEIRRELENPEHTLTGRAKLLIKEENGKKYLENGNGTLSLNRDGFTFEAGGETRNWSLKSFQFLVLNDIDFMQINTTQSSFRFVLEDGSLLYRWFFTHRALAMGQY